MSAVPRLWPQWPPRNQCHLAAHCPRSCRRRPTRPVVAVFLLGRDSRSLVGTPVRLRDRSPAGGTGLPHRGSHACDRAGRMDPGEAQAGDVLADADRATAQWAPTAAARLSGSLGEDHFSALCGSVESHGVPRPGCRYCSSRPADRRAVSHSDVPATSIEEAFLSGGQADNPGLMVSRKRIRRRRSSPLPRAMTSLIFVFSHVVMAAPSVRSWALFIRQQ
jgi:hypothetical protein